MLSARMEVSELASGDIKLWSLSAVLTANGAARWWNLEYRWLLAGLSAGVALPRSSPRPVVPGELSPSICKLTLRRTSLPAHDGLPRITLLSTSSMLLTVLLSPQGPSAPVSSCCGSPSPSKLICEPEWRPPAQPDVLREAGRPSELVWESGVNGVAAGIEGRLSVGDGDRSAVLRQRPCGNRPARVGLTWTVSACSPTASHICTRWQVLHAQTKASTGANGDSIPRAVVLELANSSSGLADDERASPPTTSGFGGASEGSVTVDAESEPCAAWSHGKLPLGDCTGEDMDSVSAVISFISCEICSCEGIGTH